MAAAEVVKLSTEYGAGITCHAFNKDGSKVAICPNSNELFIYGMGGDGKWALEHQLKEHDMLISGVDWDHGNNSIVTCSHDRNAFVWKEEAATDGNKGVTWKPSLVILRIDKSALDVRWSPNGLKFAAASGAKCVSVCSFADEDNWWVSKSIKKHKSTVLCVAWHPNSEFLATGSSDFKCRVFSAHIAGPDGASPTPCQGKTVEFGEAYYEFPSEQAGVSVGWVNACAWSPSGRSLAFAGHDASVVVVTFPEGGGEPTEQVMRLGEMPLTSLCFVSETGLVGAGHGFTPLAFSCSSGAWALAGGLEAKPEAAAKTTEAAVGGAASARAMFQKMNDSSNKGSSGGAGGDAKKVDNSWKSHQALITSLQPFGAPVGSATFPKVTTTAMDGRLVTWTLAKTPVAASLGI